MTGTQIELGFGVEVEWILGLGVVLLLRGSVLRVWVWVWFVLWLGFGFWLRFWFTVMLGVLLSRSTFGFPHPSPKKT